MFQWQHWHQSRDPITCPSSFFRLLLFPAPSFSPASLQGPRSFLTSVSKGWENVLRALTKSLCPSPFSILVPNSWGATSPAAPLLATRTHLPSCGFLAKEWGRWSWGERCWVYQTTPPQPCARQAHTLPIPWAAVISMRREAGAELLPAGSSLSRLCPPWLLPH